MPSSRVHPALHSFLHDALPIFGSRSDLNYIFQNMLSEMTVGHLRGGGGTLPQARTVPGGLLGADYEIANGRYRIKRIYTGESWNRSEERRVGKGEGQRSWSESW